MRSSKDCIFCKIIAGEIPCTKVHEDDEILCFMDISPVNRGHLLVVPKAHFTDILEIDPGLYGRVAGVAVQIAKALQAAMTPDGINVLQLNGKAANQVVPHLHMHLVPRWHGDGLTISSWDPAPGDPNEIASTAEAIRKNLSL